MTERSHTELDPQLEDVARMLREERALPDTELLERTRRRVRSRARRGRGAVQTTRKGAIMRSRLAVTALLTLGIMMMATSSGLALSGISGEGSAGAAQYRNLAPSTGTGTGTGTEDEGGPETLGELGSGVSDDQPSVQGTRQSVQGTRQVTLASDSADKLPFTGFTAIILLVGGLALLTTGLALRRGSRRQAA